MKVTWNCSAPGQTLISVCALESVLNTFGRNTGDTLRETLGKPAEVFFHPFSMPSRSEIWKERQTGSEVLFRYGMEASPVRLEKNKQTHKDAPVLASLFRAMLWNRACGDGKVPFLGCPTAQPLVMGEYWAPAVCSVPAGNWSCRFYFISVNVNSHGSAMWQTAQLQEKGTKFIFGNLLLEDTKKRALIPREGPAGYLWSHLAQASSAQTAAHKWPRSRGLSEWPGGVAVSPFGGKKKKRTN